jgi:site-specific recombinase XerD
MPNGALELDPWLASWARSLRARNLSEKTIKNYLDSGNQFAKHLATTGVANLSDIGRAQVEGFIAEVLSRRRPATASAHFRALQQFFRALLLVPWVVTRFGDRVGVGSSRRG